MRRSRRKRSFRGKRYDKLIKRAVLSAAAVLVTAGIITYGIRAGRDRGLEGAGGENLAANRENMAANGDNKAAGGENMTADGGNTASARAGQRETDGQKRIFTDFKAGFVDLSGLTAEQAEEKFRTSYEWDLRVIYGDEEVPVENVTAAWAKQTAEKIKDGDLPASGGTEPDYSSMEEKFRILVQELGSRWDKSPVDSQAESYDRETGVYTYSQERNGRTLNREALVNALLEAVRTGDLEAEIEPQFVETPPARTRAQAKEQYRVIGSFTTKTTDNKNRNQNIRLAVDAIDGMVLRPGQEFSFNLTTGNRTSEKGYQPAGAYKNGILIEEPGGGVCQVSTTLYHAIIGAGYKTTERNAHSFAPSYVEEGQDAMVSFDGYAGPDLKFVNSGSAAVVLRASFDRKNLKMSIVGLPVLEEGVTVSIRSEKVKDVDAPEPVYEENSSLPYGTERIVDQGKSGSVWKSYRIISKNGEIQKEEPLHNSYYKSKTAVVQINSQTPPQQAVSEADETAAEEKTGADQEGAGENPGADRAGAGENQGMDRAGAGESQGMDQAGAGNNQGMVQEDTGEKSGMIQDDLGSPDPGGE